MPSEPDLPARSQSDLPSDLPATLDPQTAAELRTAAAKVLRANDRGTMTVAAPELYPHQWSWDAAFVTVGLSHLSVPRACVELESLLAGQWRSGMIPHIVFSTEEAPYFPGPEWWRTHELAEAAPRSPLTSGICQPPVHAIGLAHVLAAARRNGGDDLDIAEEFARRAWPALYAWHRWLINARRDEPTGLIAIVHSWESGLDNSPRWDAPYRAVPKGPLPPYHRRDVGVVDDLTQRPSDREYDRYLWLVEELKHAGYDDATIAEKGSFRVGDVLFSAILSVACDVLADLAEGLRPPVARHPVDDLRRWAAELREAVAGTVDPATGLARDYDIRAGQWLGSDTLAGFAPLLCGGLPATSEQWMYAILDGPDWCGHPSLVVPAPPSTSLRSDALDRRRYWRGPLWPVTIWLYAWALARRGEAGGSVQGGAIPAAGLTKRARALRHAGLTLVSDGQFGEYYEPVTGEALGSADQSWTAAVALDWLS